jgi:hypothetical protein
MRTANAPTRNKSRTADLRRAFVSVEPVARETSVPRRTDHEEVLVVDARAHLSPAQFVERKLMALLAGRFSFSQMLLMAIPRGPIADKGTA